MKTWGCAILWPQTAAHPPFQTLSAISEPLFFVFVGKTFSRVPVHACSASSSGILTLLYSSTPESVTTPSSS